MGLAHCKHSTVCVCVFEACLLCHSLGGDSHHTEKCANDGLGVKKPSEVSSHRKPSFMVTHVTKLHLFLGLPPAPRQTDIYHPLLVAPGHWTPSILTALTLPPKGLGRSLHRKANNYLLAWQWEWESGQGSLKMVKSRETLLKVSTAIRVCCWQQKV